MRAGADAAFVAFRWTGCDRSPEADARGNSGAGPLQLGARRAGAARRRGPTAARLGGVVTSAPQNERQGNIAPATRRIRADREPCRVAGAETGPTAERKPLIKDPLAGSRGDLRCCAARTAPVAERSTRGCSGFRLSAIQGVLKGAKG